MPQWITDLFAGWPMIRANLPSFVFIVILIFAAVWWLMDWRYGGIITNRDSEISLLKGQRDDYKDKLSGATPDQAKAKIEGLERAVHMAIGAKWEPLTKAEIAILVPKLRLIQKSRIQIIYENAFGKELAQSFLDAERLGGMRLR